MRVPRNRAEPSGQQRLSSGQRRSSTSQGSTNNGPVPMFRYERYPPSPENGSMEASRIQSPPQDRDSIRSNVGMNRVPQLSMALRAGTASPIPRDSMSGHQRTIPSNDPLDAFYRPQALPERLPNLTSIAPMQVHGPPGSAQAANFAWRARNLRMLSQIPIGPRSANRNPPERLSNVATKAQVPRLPGLMQYPQVPHGRLQAPNIDIPKRTPTEPHSPHSAAYSEYAQAQEDRNANCFPPENIRPVPQNLRYGAYPGQPAPQSRNTPLGSGRLQNTSKPGASQLAIIRTYTLTADVT